MLLILNVSAKSVFFNSERIAELNSASVIPVAALAPAAVVYLVPSGVCLAASVSSLTNVKSIVISFALPSPSV